MSINWVDDVKKFHEKFNIYLSDKPGLPSKDVINLRLQLVIEEYTELLNAHTTSNIEEIAKEIIDSIYVLIGMGISYGLPLEKIWDEVHRTNMCKTGGSINEDGKLLKPNDWKPPFIAEILNGSSVCTSCNSIIGTTNEKPCLCQLT